jgi:hypothetical protein
MLNKTLKQSISSCTSSFDQHLAISHRLCSLEAEILQHGKHQSLDSQMNELAIQLRNQQVLLTKQAKMDRGSLAAEIQDLLLVQKS